ncbi:retron Ec78 anti-phage system effector HNH endonuclease PtuB [Pseudoalteromonas sp. Angola-4]|uniref:retron Ec78 anti-phage system effector HNH endonuclease PtuB n=1 Tax=Pseudoalteromonas sp. Angola-4 TaxID=3025335 RepID=UPI0023599BCD|nr:retron Ec78 anti-phage system effector HNH endonuclease PtuB [Pseudoalteromonas sp. Angola-4]MDC9509002.1 TIGR02646 family protein [Pseudoalteromonas sp. Angola-4]
MKKLNRPQPAPAALANYNYQTHKWTSRRPSAACRTQIWQHFQTMQGNFCAFCERTTYQGNGHIEHFFHKGQKPDGSTPYKHLTFTWSNLFGCCGTHTSNTCGHYKDRQGSQGPGAYNANDLIKPDTDDPALFFNFLDTGVIEAKQGLSVQNKKRALETIRVLNLSALNGVRKRQIDIFKNELKALEEISAGLDDQQLAQELNQIKNRIQQQEHQTAVLDALF